MKCPKCGSDKVFPINPVNPNNSKYICMVCRYVWERYRQLKLEGGCCE